MGKKDKKRDSMHGGSVKVLSKGGPPVITSENEAHAGSSDTSRFHRNLVIAGICLFLVFFCAVLYWRVSDYPFTRFDDRSYVYENSFVRAGLNTETIKWAFSFSEKEGTYWHPLTWLSHMLDVELWGLDAGMHHLTNLLLHIVNVLLLFFVLWKMTGALWKSAFVAALFALHPINVDTVAWIAERKNLLSTLFWMLVMLMYYYYSQRPIIVRYGVVCVLFVLGLLAKPMLVTLPFVLLLLDYWPLRRIELLSGPELGTETWWQTTARNLRNVITSPAVLEKIPLIILGFLVITAASHSLRISDAIISFKEVPLGLRIGNAFVSYVTYVIKVFWPQNYAIYYPFPKVIPLWQATVSLLFLVVVTLGVMRAFFTQRYLVVGWFWFVGTLVPVSGLMQAGLWPAMADRWAYVPLIGVFIMVAWGVPALLKKYQKRKVMLVVAASCFLIILSASSWKQLGYWRDNIILFEHTLKITENNDVARAIIGLLLMEQGDLSRAIEQFQQALKINPNYSGAYDNLGVALKKKGDLASAIEAFNRAIQADPRRVQPYNNLGVVFLGQGKNEEALRLLSRAVELNPLHGESLSNLGLAYARLGNEELAIEYFRKAIRYGPFQAKPYSNVALALIKRGDVEGAITHYRRALEIEPDLEEALSGLGVALARKGDLDGAIQTFEKVLRVNPGNSSARQNVERLRAVRDRGQ